MTYKINLSDQNAPRLQVIDKIKAKDVQLHCFGDLLVFDQLSSEVRVLDAQTFDLKKLLQIEKPPQSIVMAQLNLVVVYINKSAIYLIDCESMSVYKGKFDDRFTGGVIYKIGITYVLRTPGQPPVQARQALARF